MDANSDPQQCFQQLQTSVEKALASIAESSNPTTIINNLTEVINSLTAVINNSTEVINSLTAVIKNLTAVTNNSTEVITDLTAVITDLTEVVTGIAHDNGTGSANAGIAKSNKPEPSSEDSLTSAVEEDVVDPEAQQGSGNGPVQEPATTYIPSEDRARVIST
ncbi:hypothetical protein QBC47DRAFT_416096 [Echria macrotheca]|uniref:Uncharacterized protein n=1 Tax=Echria macrotheca TaxID=438768 RepID=A0AAJ0B938_9PEZI|nr:hypothetical protein QBC47DRAFT_416096 [Echria macrotheca]